METSSAMLQSIDAGGVCPLLFMVSGFAAMERGSELVEPQDLIKAIYIVDLEHVSEFWNEWQGFETLVSSGPLTNKHSNQYLNRTLYLVRIEFASRDNPEGFIGLGNLSSSFQRIVAEARRFASLRAGIPATPSSRDILYSVCSQDAVLSEALQKSGLQLDRLEASVRK